MLKFLAVSLLYAAVAGTVVESYAELQQTNSEEGGSEFDSGIDSRKLNSRPNIARLVQNNHRLDTLQAALEATGLDSTLRGSGPFTLFAPTDAAFADLDEEGLLEDTDQLSDILLYHVVKGRIMRNQMKNDVIKAANGDNIRVGILWDGDVSLNGSADIATFNIMASNGVVHLIDEVLIPPDDLVDRILSLRRFSTLAAAVKAAGLTSTLKSMSKEYTMFAPNNAAFAALGQDTIDKLLKDPVTLKSILLYHTVTGSVLRSDLRNTGSAKTVQGSNIQYRNSSGGLIINTSKVLKANILAANGVIHEIDEVLTIPK